MSNKYYEEQTASINKNIEEGKFEEAAIQINEELSMPYIPVKFEEYLISALERIPMTNRQDNFRLGLDKVIDLLIKLDKSKSDMTDLINSLEKFNLSAETEELEYYFSNSSNKRNRATLYELLINFKVDIETPLGNPKDSVSVLEDEKYIKDVEKVKLLVDELPEMVEVIVGLVKDIYLTKHLGQELEGDYAQLAIYTIAKIFEHDQLMNLVEDLDLVKQKMESIKTFDTL